MERCEHRSHNNCSGVWFRTLQVKQLRRIFLKSILVLTVLASANPAKIKAEDSQTSASTKEQYLLEVANRERMQRGLQPLLRDPALARAAAFHARQMADHEDISHEFPGEPDLTARASTAGVRFSLVSENVAEGPEPAMIHSMWMESEGHRENLLDPNVNAAGIAIVEREGQLFAVEDFASIVEDLTLDQQEETVVRLIEAWGIPVANRLQAQAAEATIQFARQTCTLSTGYIGSRKPRFVMRYTAASLKALPTTLQTRISSGKYHQAAVGACAPPASSSFTAYNIAVLLYP
jgi:uncharacterized protein YkwD